MKLCKSCNITFNTKEKLCPLCQNKLLGTVENVVFPSNIRAKTNIFILKWLLFISLTTIIIMSFFEIYLNNVIYYTFFVGGGLLTNYLMTCFILKNKENILKLFGKYGLILIFLALIWFIATKNMIITNYIIPSFCMFELIFNVISFIVLKNNYLVNYLNLMLLNILLLLVPAILILLKCTTFDLLAYICLVLALILLTGLIIFYFDAIKNELKKIFNI